MRIISREAEVSSSKERARGVHFLRGAKPKTMKGAYLI